MKLADFNKAKPIVERLKLLGELANLGKQNKIKVEIKATDSSLEPIILTSIFENIISYNKIVNVIEESIQDAILIENHNLEEIGKQ